MDAVRPGRTYEKTGIVASGTHAEGWRFVGDVGWRAVEKRIKTQSAGSEGWQAIEKRIRTPSHPEYKDDDFRERRDKAATAFWHSQASSQSLNEALEDAFPYVVESQRWRYIRYAEAAGLVPTAAQRKGARRKRS